MFFFLFDCKNLLLVGSPLAPVFTTAGIFFSLSCSFTTPGARAELSPIYLYLYNINIDIFKTQTEKFLVCFLPFFSSE